MQTQFYSSKPARSSVLVKAHGGLPRADRRGAAAVEFALVAPLLILTIVMPIFEFGRGMMVSEQLTHAARVGCRAGLLPGNSSSTVTSLINTNLSGQGISNATVTVNVNGAATDVSAAKLGDTVTVTISVPYSSIGWMSGQFLAGRRLSANVSMLHE